MNVIFGMEHASLLLMKPPAAKRKKCASVEVVNVHDQWFEIAKINNVSVQALGLAMDLVTARVKKKKNLKN